MVICCQTGSGNAQMSAWHDGYSWEFGISFLIPQPQSLLGPENARLLVFKI